MLLTTTAESPRRAVVQRPTSALGQKAKYSQGADVFRCSPNIGHSVRARVPRAVTDRPGVGISARKTPDHDNGRASDDCRRKRCGSQPAGTEARGSAGASTALPVVWPLIRRFRIAEGLNTTTRREDIGTSVPVFGLRPMR
jgi:hypothetical protein